MLSKKHTKNACSLCNNSDHTARGVPAQDALVRTPLWLTMMKAFPSGNGLSDPKLANRNASRRLALCPQVLICPPPLQGQHPMVTSLRHQSKVIIQLMKDGDGKRTFELGPIVTISCHPWDSNAKDLFHGKEATFPLLISTFDSSELTLSPFVEPSHPNEPPIPGPSQSSKSHEDVPTCEPEPEVAPKQSLEQPFACPTTPRLVIIINNMPTGSLSSPPSSPTPPPSPPIAPKNPTAYSPHSHNEALKEFTNLQPTLMIS
ncbi:hypothetical protein O181_012657 [Austropuccinia psidii MF-1]|uniref:Uncharacterized protein n=1 Tax=Austropuccinia psidii MF-1 TaxID=1389203 RepID=A0A9Q3BWU6_9BASI|nr:hypothetical protein [Austropuccinia psidii MF-1]